MLTAAGRVGSRPLPFALAAVVVVAQIAYPLAHGDGRSRLTIAIVLLFALTCVVDAARTSARSAVSLLAVTALGGFAVEVVGVHTGVPFGDYRYSSTLGPRVVDVPLVVAFAWTMLAWPAALAARRLVTGLAARVAVGAWALASADLFLDPQMTAAGCWRWLHPAPHLPGVPDVPLTNYAGWLVVSLLLSAAVQTLLATRPPADDRVGLGLYLWLYAGWVVSFVFFLDLRAAALWGALGMGVVAVPLVVRLWRG